MQQLSKASRMVQWLKVYSPSLLQKSRENIPEGTFTDLGIDWYRSDDNTSALKAMISIL